MANQSTSHTTWKATKDTLAAYNEILKHENCQKQRQQQKSVRKRGRKRGGVATLPVRPVRKWNFAMISSEGNRQERGRWGEAGGTGINAFPPDWQFWQFLLCNKNDDVHWLNCYTNCYTAALLIAECISMHLLMFPSDGDLQCILWCRLINCDNLLPAEKTDWKSW